MSAQEKVTDEGLTKNLRAEAHLMHREALLNLAEYNCVVPVLGLKGVVRRENSVRHHRGVCRGLSLAEAIPNVGMVVTKKKLDDEVIAV